MKKINKNILKTGGSIIIKNEVDALQAKKINEEDIKFDDVYFSIKGEAKVADAKRALASAKREITIAKRMAMLEDAKLDNNYLILNLNNYFEVLKDINKGVIIKAFRRIGYSFVSADTLNEVFQKTLLFWIEFFNTKKGDWLYVDEIVKSTFLISQWKEFSYLSWGRHNNYYVSLNKKEKRVDEAIISNIADTYPQDKEAEEEARQQAIAKLAELSAMKVSKNDVGVAKNKNDKNNFLKHQIADLLLDGKSIRKVMHLTGAKLGLVQLTRKALQEAGKIK